MATPTRRTLNLFREHGFKIEVVERFIRGANVKKDLFGFIDMIAISGPRTVGIQATTMNHRADRLRKIQNSELALLWADSPTRELWLVTWGMRKGTDARGTQRNLWTHRIDEISVVNGKIQDKRIQI